MENRTPVTEKDRAKLDAVRNLLRASKDPNAALKLEDIDRFERQAGMTASEKIEDMKKDNSQYKEARLLQRFSSIKGIYGVRGCIYIDVDEHKSLEAAKLKAFRVLGPLAPAEEVKQYIANNTEHSKVLTVPMFRQNLQTVLMMVAHAPEYFGEGRGGGEIRDIVEASKAAIRDARGWLFKHRHVIPEQTYKMLASQPVQLNDEKDFALLLGDEWKKDLVAAANQSSATRLIIGDK